MNGERRGPGDAPLSEQQVGQLIEEYEAEAPTRRLDSWVGRLVTALATVLSLYALYWVLFPVTTQLYRISFLLLVLVLTLIVYPPTRRQRERVTALDWLLVGAAVLALAYPLLDFNQFLDRGAGPTPLDLAAGIATTLLVLEATRRSIGWILPAVAVAFIAYAMLGGQSWIPDLIAHRGYGLPRLVGSLFMGLEGIFGVPLDVAATYIVLFTIYGAALEYSGAGKFFLDFSLAAMGRSRSGAGPGRTVTLAGFLLGTVSGSGVATTVTLGSVAWPLLRRAGYDRETGGAILSAGGIGAILSPPTLGAAAFLIAEFLKISYLQVLLMATVPTILYYLSIFLMIEADSRRIGTRHVDMAVPPMWRLLRRHGYHFSSLIAIVVLMALGFSAFLAVFWATILAIALSFLDRETALGPRKLLATLAAGGKGVLSVAATTATAGIIVGVVTLTGLGLKIANIIVSLAGGSLFLTVLYAAIAVWILGLAVPVTASYIIAAVIIVPALTTLGVADFAAHMFIFYYAVLSEVSPPTALSPFAAAAITGGNPFRTMMLSWKYCLPAFLVPFMFTLKPEGVGLLLRGEPLTMVWTFASACLAVGALAIGFGGWIRRAASGLERGLAIAAGLLLLYPDAAIDGLGLLLLAMSIGIHWWRVGRGREAWGR
jgi:TRAP transporter 4TM/12TM fusion protein